ncbi:MAG: translocation/assembly module TamB domain-containing protein, partial [Bacillota bacterium]
MTNNAWQVDLNTNYFNLKEINNVLEENNLINNYLSELAINDLNGNLKTSLSLKGKETKIEKYKTELNLRDVNLNLSYGDKLKNDKFSNLSGQVLISSENEKIIFDKLSFKFLESDYNIDGEYNYVDNKADAKLNSYNFSLSGLEKIFKSNYKNLEDYSLAGEGKVDMTLNGSIRDPKISLDFYLAEGKIDENKIKNFKTELEYKNDTFYLDLFDLIIDDNSNITVDGIYKPQLEEYNFSFKGKKINSQLVNKYLKDENLAKINGDLNFDFNISGKGFNKENLNALGEVEIKTDSLGNLYSELWLGRENLIIDQGFWKIKDNYLNFGGEIDFANKNYDLELDSNEFTLNSLNDFSKFLTDDRREVLANLKGNLNFSAQLNDDFNSPNLTADINLTKLNYGNIKIDQIESDLNYKNKKFNLNNIDLEDNSITANGSLNFDLSNDKVQYKANLDSKKVSYEYLINKLSTLNLDFVEKIKENNLALNGDLGTNLKINGDMSNYRIETELSSNNTGIKFNDKKFESEKLNTSFTINEDFDIDINNFAFKIDDSQFNLAGEILDSNYNLSYNAKNFAISQFLENSKVDAKGEFDGKIYGKLMSPVISGDLNLNNINYEDYNLDKAELSYKLENNNLSIEDGFWNLGSNQLKLSGKILDIFSERRLALDANIDRANVDDILSQLGEKPSFDLNYYLQGNAEIKGNINSPAVNLSLAANSLENNQGQLNIFGSVTDNYNLKFIASDFKIENFANVFDLDLGLKGSADFNALLSGPLDNYEVEMTTNIVEANFRGVSANNIRGYLTYNQGSNINIHQELEMGQNGNVSVDGSIDPLSRDMNLNIISKKLPLQLLAPPVKMVSSIEGKADANINLSGDFTDPDLKGDVEVASNSLDLNLPNKFSNLNAKLRLEDNYIAFDSFSGKYSNADFSLGGRIYPFDKDDFWELNLKANSLPFEHGSFGGKFDSENLQMRGALTSPDISGDLLTHDFVASMPFEWPTSEGEGESTFNPNIDLTLRPGENVYFRSGNNIDVLVEEGELRLLFEEEFQMEGELSSRQGSFEYYNNKFNLNNATASFRRFNGVVPNLNVTASTNVDGVGINVRMDGPADNMIVTFTSQPELSQREIISLLTQKGSIGEFIEDEDFSNKDVQDLAIKEFRRILQSVFQFNVVSEIESDLKDSLNLDRIEIDTYELGWSDELSITLGKNLRDDFYLEYENTITSSEIENKISFSYPITEKSRIEGSWYGDNNFSLSVDTLIEF